MAAMSAVVVAVAVTDDASTQDAARTGTKIERRNKVPSAHGQGWTTSVRLRESRGCGRVASLGLPGRYAPAFSPTIAARSADVIGCASRIRPLAHSSRSGTLMSSTPRITSSRR